jgi:TonB family protein
MKVFIDYLIEANIGICFFLLLYKILLSKETDHGFSRAFLLFALVISMALPFFHFQVPPLLTIDNDLPSYLLPEIQVNSLRGPVIQFDSFWFWTSSIYLLGVVTLFILFLFRLLKIGKGIYQSPKVKNGTVWLIEINDEREVFSFFKFIFIGKTFQFTELEKKQIIRHEQVHINNIHSLDILFVNLLGILFWFNPFLKVYRKSLVQLHEFEADARSVERAEVDSYCCLLARAALQSSGYQLANHFTNSLTLKRIEMMKTVKTKISKWKVASIVSIAVAFCFLVAGNGFVLAQEKSDPKSISSSDEVFGQVDELPTFGKGPQYAELFEFIGKNLRYPEEAVTSKVEGKVFAEFVVEKDGSVSNVKAVKGIGHGCDEEVVRVVKSLPKWNPGEKDGKIVRTKFTLPIVFQLPVKKKVG